MGFVARVFSPPKPKAPPKPPPAPKTEPVETEAQKATKRRKSAAKLGGAGYGQGSVMSQMEESGTSRTILGS
tara:strand:+ start:851 stop:1066 length:216 start_codon:yes stop_codon:yes gene_type:complete